MSLVSKFAVSVALISFSSLGLAKEKDPEFQKKIDKRIEDVKEWAKDPVVVSAFGPEDSKLAEKYGKMNQETWKSLTVLSPEVRDLTKTPVAVHFKEKKKMEPSISEVFLSRANGTKVGFLTKTTSWSHLGKDKHDLPMKNQVWQGPVETDESSGSKQIQVAVPVLKDGKAVGSLVVGFKVTLL